jgi:hypothetical protein
VGDGIRNSTQLTKVVSGVTMSEGSDTLFYGSPDDTSCLFGCMLTLSFYKHA